MFHGSSPLSRGIRISVPVRGSRGRIIPALAGNTRRRSPGRCRRRDHPRSRGEYWGDNEPDSALVGSSPLSRGIRRARAQQSLGLGIIPALAGNTRLPGKCAGSLGDHPRSRGEYLPAPRQVRHPPWIIPALAGNTRGRSTKTSSQTDHPRSRGEYRVVQHPPAFLDGSSPLSRGIPQCWSSRPCRDGIIPALAGNTRRAGSAVMYARDHPRSRGEYWGDNEPDSALVGSSPLSRGIPTALDVNYCYNRIIPALAGNTTEPYRHGTAVSDHPRSRGEYP